MRDGDQRTKARTDRQYYDAVKRAIGAFRRWWRRRGWFNDDMEAEDQHVRIMQKIAAQQKRERRRAVKQQRQGKHRPRLVEVGRTSRDDSPEL